MSVVDRITQIIDLKGINKNKFYKQTGLSNGFLDKVRDIGASKIEQILNTYPDVNPVWLITGRGVPNEKFVALQDEKGAPLIPIEAMAGYGGGDQTVSKHEIEATYLIPEFKGRVDFYTRVTGNSMYPRYNSGDIVACQYIRELAFIQWNKPYVLDTSQGAMVKRLIQDGDEQMVICRSDNKDYPDFQLPRTHIRNVALIIGVIRFE